MNIYEYYNGSRFSYIAKGEHGKKSFINAVMADHWISLIGKHLGEVFYIYKVFGPIKEEEHTRMGYSKCDKFTKGAEIFTKVVVI